MPSKKAPGKGNHESKKAEGKGKEGDRELCDICGTWVKNVTALSAHRLKCQKRRAEELAEAARAKAEAKEREVEYNENVPRSARVTNQTQGAQPRN